MMMIRVRIYVRVNPALRKKIIGIGMIINMGLHLEMRVRVRRAIHQFKIHHHEYLLLYYP